MTYQRETVKTIFGKALEINSDDERARYLDQACRGNESLRAEVNDLLNAIDRAGQFLGDSSPGGTTTDQPITDSLGTQIGPYKLLEEIGEGGFGVVYMAEQQTPVKRKVALKIIKPGMDTKQVIARFEAERQALAMMDHPNIAKVLDAGMTENERPYFVMELVKGIPITKFCDQQRLTPQQRLQLFIPICQAVHHAHQKGIIHRDLKPSNVLLALYDGRPVPKVIDFGVAKATNQKLTERTMFTQFGQIVGTLEYMSPEQAELNQLDVDTRSDVYSLGVLLYELLTGSTPLGAERVRKAGYAEILRVIREEETPRLSARLSTMGEELTVAAKYRSVEPHRLQQVVRGELDWIVLRALEKDRGRRYQSTGELSADIQRYLDDEAVEACPPSRTYQIRKFVSRNRGLVSAIAAVLASLVIGLGIATYAFVVAEQRRFMAEQSHLNAERESSRAKRIAQTLNEMLESADPSTGKAADYTVRAMLDEFAGTLDGRFDDDPRVESNLRHIIGRVYFHLGLPDASEPHLRRALKLCEGDPEQQLREARVLTDLAQMLTYSFSELGPAAPGRGGTPSTNVLNDPEYLVRRAIENYQNLGEATAELANALCVLGWILYQQSGGVVTRAGENHEAEKILRDGIKIVETSTDTRSLIVKGRLFVRLTFQLWRRGASKEANELAERGLKLLREHSPHDRFMRWALLADGIRKLHGNLSEAEVSLREAKAIEERTIGSVQFETLSILMTAMFRQGRISEAFDIARTSPMDVRASLHPTFGRTRVVVGCHHLGLGDFENAEREFSIAREHCFTHLGREHFATTEAQFRLAQALANQDDKAKQLRAQEIFTTLLPISRAAVQMGIEPYVYGYTYIVGNLECPSSDDVQLALEVNRHVLQQPLQAVYRLRNVYAGALAKNKAGETEEAMALLQESIALRTAYDWSAMGGDPSYFVLRNAEDVLARMLLQSGEKAPAEKVYRSAISRREAAKRPDQYQIIFAKQRLARFLREQGNHEEAYQLLNTAREALADAPKCFDWLQERVHQDLARLGEPQNSND